MGFYSNTNTTRVVRAAVVTDEIWNLYKKAKDEFSRGINHLPSVSSYPVIKVSREKNSTSMLLKLKLIGSIAGSINSGNLTYLKRLLLPLEASDEECRDLMKDLFEHGEDSEYCNKAVIRWYLENLHAVCVAEGDVNKHEHIFILDKNGEVSKIHTQLNL